MQSQRHSRRSAFTAIALAIAGTAVGITSIIGTSRSAHGEGVVRITDMSTLLAAVERSAAVTVSSYVLPPDSRLAVALTDAASKHSDVVLVLDSEPVAGAQNSINNTISALAPRGVQMRLSRGPLHLKSVLLDRREVYLSDRNFTSNDAIVVVSDDPDDYNAVIQAMSGNTSAQSPHLRLQKKAALELEAGLIAGGSGPLDVESESFSASSVVCRTLLERARHDRVRLIVSGDELDDGQHDYEARSLHTLEAAGVHVGVGRSNEKIAIESADGWVGSANATGNVALDQQAEWGMVSDDRLILDALHTHFERDWANARTF